MNRFRIILPMLLLSACGLLGWAQGRIFTVQTASMPTEAEAKEELAKLAAAGLKGHLVKAAVQGKGTRYRVRFGRYNSQEDAKQQAEQALKRGAIKEYIVTFYETPTQAHRETPVTAEKAEPAKPPKTGKDLAASKTKEPEGAGANVAAKTPAAKNNDVPKAKPLIEAPTREPVKESGNKKSANNAKGSNAVETAKASGPEVKTAPAQPAPSAAHEPKTAPTVETKTPEPPKPVEPKLGPKAEPKSEPKTEPAPPSTKATDPKAADLDKAAAAPRIAGPPIADALGEMDITNHNWKIVRKSTSTDKNLRTIYFVDSMTGWAAGDAGAVYRTTDGGKTWKPLLTAAAANITQIQFVDWNHGWMLGEITRRDTDEPETIVLRTTNGGRSWDKKALPNILSIFFTDAQHGWAVGKNATILRTEDGGLEWKAYADLEKVIGLPVESSNYNFGFRDIYFLNPQQGWLIGNFYGRAKSHIGGVFVTSDGGVSWKRVPLTVQTQHSSGRFTPGVFHSVHFSDQTTGSVTGEMMDGEGRFFFALHTRDGGKNWEQHRTPSRAAHSTQFLTPGVGWTAAAAPREGGADAVVYDTTLMRTDNGGASWQYDFVARGNRIRGVYFLSPYKGWAVGDRGMILRYEEKVKAN